MDKKFYYTCHRHDCADPANIDKVFFVPINPVSGLIFFAHGWLQTIIFDVSFCSKKTKASQGCFAAVLKSVNEDVCHRQRLVVVVVVVTLLLCR